MTGAEAAAAPLLSVGGSTLVGAEAWPNAEPRTRGTAVQQASSSSGPALLAKWSKIRTLWP